MHNMWPIQNSANRLRKILYRLKKKNKFYIKMHCEFYKQLVRRIGADETARDLCKHFKFADPSSPVIGRFTISYAENIL